MHKGASDSTVTSRPCVRYKFIVNGIVFIMHYSPTVMSV